MLKRASLLAVAAWLLPGCVNLRLESYWQGEYRRKMEACAETAKGEVQFLGETASSGADPLTVAAMARSSRRKLSGVADICKPEPFWIFADAYAQAVEGGGASLKVGTPIAWGQNLTAMVR